MKVMKERNRKMDSFINRRDLLSVLGLGFTLLGASAIHGSEEAPKEEAPKEAAALPGVEVSKLAENVRIVAGLEKNNVWKFDENGNLPTSPTGSASIFRTGGALGISGSAELINVVFNEENYDTYKDFLAGVAPLSEATKNSVKDSIDPVDGKGAPGTIKEGEKDSEASQGYVHAAVTTLQAACNELAAIKYVNIMSGITIGTADKKNGVIATTEEISDVALKAIQAAFAEAATGHKFADADAAVNALKSLKSATGTEAITIADGIEITPQESGETTADKIKATATALETALGEGELEEITKPELAVPIKLAAKYAQDAKDLETALTAAVNAVEEAKGKESSPAQLTEARAKLRTLLDTYREKLAAIGEDLSNVKDALKNPLGAVPSGAYIAATLEAKLNGWLSDGSAAGALFTIAPTTESEANRTYVRQISVQNLTKVLDLGGKVGTFIVINTANMKAGDTSLIPFENFGFESDDVKNISIGDIAFVSTLDKDLTLSLMNALRKKNSDGTFSGGATVTVNAPTLGTEAISKFLTLSLFRYEAKEGTDPDFKFSQPVRVKQVLLGTPDTFVGRPTKNDKAQDIPLGNQSVYSEFERGLQANGISVHGHSQLKVTGENLVLGGNVVFGPKAQLTLFLGSGGAVQPLITSASTGGAFLLGTDNAMNLASNVKFVIVANEKNGLHNYIVLEGGNESTPIEFNLRGKKLAVGPSVPLSGLETFNGDSQTQLFLIKEGSVVKISGNSTGGAAGTLSIDGELDENTAKKISLIRMEKGAELTLDPIILDGGKFNAPVTLGKHSTLRLLDRDSVTFKKNNLVFGNDSRIEIVLTGEAKTGDNEVLVWLEGDLIPAEEGDSLSFAIDDGKILQEKGIFAVGDILKKYKSGETKLSINFGSNPNKSAILQKLQTAFSNNFLIGGLDFDFEKGSMDFANVVVPESLEDFFSENFTFAYVSDDLKRLLEEGALKSEKERLEIVNGMLRYVWDKELKEEEKSAIFAAFSKTTTEEKNRATLTLINAARETIYSEMGLLPMGDKHYNIWFSGFGDSSRNGFSETYKTNCDIFGFVLGADMRVNDQFLVGLAAGYGKGKLKFRGDYSLEEEDGSKGKCDLKSYFGGVYGMWDGFVDDLNIKFSLLGGQGKYNEDFVLPTLSEDMDMEGSEDESKGRWISGNIDFTYKHWNLNGLNVGPWLGLSVATVHQRSNDASMGGTPDENNEGKDDENTAVEKESFSYNRHVGSSDRRSIETTFGIAADYAFNSGTLEVAMGYKHDFRHLKGGDITISKIDRDENLMSNPNLKTAEQVEFSASGIETGKNVFVAKVAWDMKLGDFGLSIGGHGQVGNHFRDIAGSITASYSF
jgi:hypothetical protein